MILLNLTPDYIDRNVKFYIIKNRIINKCLIVEKGKAMKMEKDEKDFFVKVYNETFYNLRQYVKRRILDPNLVDDVLQEIYMEIVRHIEDLKTHENYRGWIYKTAENKVKKINKICYHYAEYEIKYENISEIQLEKGVESTFLLYEQLKETLLEDEYELIIKKYKDGYSHQNLADMTGSTLSGTKMKISRIMKKLRNHLFP